MDVHQERIETSAAGNLTSCNTVDVDQERIEASVAGNSPSCEVQRDEPYDGMIFISEDAARAYYDEYAARVGFLTRVLSSRRSERDGSIISRGLGCRGIPDTQKSGVISNGMGEKRKEGCTAMLVVKRENAEKWVVRKFVKDHNHALVLSSSKRRPAFDGKDKKIQELTAELRVKKRLSTAYREQLLNLMNDVENHNDHLSAKVQLIRNNLKELESRRLDLVSQNKPS